MIKTILFAWLAFVVVAYLFMWLDSVYYRKDLPGRFQKVLDSFTEEN